MRRRASMLGNIVLVVLCVSSCGKDENASLSPVSHTPVVTPPPTVTTFLMFSSEEGHYLGRGRAVTFTSLSAPFEARSHIALGSNTVHVSVRPTPGELWQITLSAPGGRALAAGTYDGAGAWPFQDRSVPGIELIAANAVCTGASGSFAVREAAFGPNGTIERFHATFVHRCGPAGTPALTGEVRYQP